MILSVNLAVHVVLFIAGVKSDTIVDRPVAVEAYILTSLEIVEKCGETLNELIGLFLEDPSIFGLASLPPSNEVGLGNARRNVAKCLQDKSLTICDEGISVQFQQMTKWNTFISFVARCPLTVCFPFSLR